MLLLFSVLHHWLTFDSSIVFVQTIWSVELHLFFCFRMSHFYLSILLSLLLAVCVSFYLSLTTNFYLSINDSLSFFSSLFQPLLISFMNTWWPIFYSLSFLLPLSLFLPYFSLFLFPSYSVVFTLAAFLGPGEIF